MKLHHISFIFCLCLLNYSCGEKRSVVKGEPDSPSSKANQLDENGLIVVKDTDMVFLGPLHTNSPGHVSLPRQHCVGGETLMEGSQLRLGRLNLFGIEADTVPTSGGTFVAFGQRRPNLLDRLVPKGKCPPPEARQVRSDWNADEGGEFTTNERLEATDYIEVQHLYPVNVLKVQAPTVEKKGSGYTRDDPEVRGKHVTVTVNNPFNVEMKGLEVVIHYETSHIGKPRPFTDRVTMDIGPGLKRSITRPLFVEDGGTGFLFDSAWLDKGKPAALGSPFHNL